MTKKTVFFIFFSFLFDRIVSRDQFDYIDTKIQFISDLLSFKNLLQAQSQKYTLLIVYLNDSSNLETMAYVYDKLYDAYSKQGVLFRRAYVTMNGLLDELQSLGNSNQVLYSLTTLPALFIIGDNQIIGPPLEGVHSYQKVQEYVKATIGLK
jgi:hypothetical protein